MNDAGFNVRSSQAADLASIQALLQPFVHNQLLLPRSNDQLSRLLESGFVAASQDLPIGFAAVEIYSAKLAEVQCLAVAEQWQSKGVGRALIEACVEFAAQQQVLELMAISAEEDFLRSCGFDYSLPGQKRALFISPPLTD